MQVRTPQPFHTPLPWPSLCFFGISLLLLFCNFPCCFSFCAFSPSFPRILKGKPKFYIFRELPCVLPKKQGKHAQDPLNWVESPILEISLVKSLVLYFNAPGLCTVLISWPSNPCRFRFPCFLPLLIFLAFVCAFFLSFPKILVRGSATRKTLVFFCFFLAFSERASVVCTLVAMTRVIGVNTIPFQNHYTHEITIFELFRGLRLQLSGVLRIN